MPTPVPVLRKDLQVIECFDDDSTGFHGVYPKGRDRFCAKPWKAIHIGSTFRTPEQAARAVVGWWKEQFGCRWEEAYRNRREKPWRVVGQASNPGWTCWGRTLPKPVKLAYGYRLFVWELGRQRCLPPPDPNAVLFADQASARWHYKRWAYKTYGMFESVYVTPFPNFMVK